MAHTRRSPAPVGPQLHPKLDILPASQRWLWPSLAGLAGHGFVLHGGTAIALRLGHRESVDFDFFSGGALPRARLSSVFPEFTAVRGPHGRLPDWPVALKSRSLL